MEGLASDQIVTSTYFQILESQLVLICFVWRTFCVVNMNLDHYFSWLEKAWHNIKEGGSTIE